MMSIHISSLIKIMHEWFPMERRELPSSDEDIIRTQGSHEPPIQKPHGHYEYIHSGQTLLTFMPKWAVGSSISNER